MDINDWSLFLDAKMLACTDKTEINKTVFVILFFFLSTIYEFFFLTRLSIAVNLCKQRAPTTRKHVKPYSMKIIMFIIVKAMGRCITSLVVSRYFTYLASENSSVNSSKQGFRQADRNWDLVCTE